MDVNRRRRNVCIADVGPGRINRLNDRFVKYLFGVEAHKNLLLDFINDVLFPAGEARFESIELLNSELSQGGNDLKLSRLDLSALMRDGSSVDVEVQVLNEHDFRQRMPYYCCMRHAGKLKVGTPYVALAPTIFIGVLAFNLLEEESDYRNVYALRNEKSGNLLCRDLQLIYLELPKFLERQCGDVPQTGLERWLLYLCNEEGELMEQTATLDVEIGQALDLEKIFWSDEEERFKYIARQKWIMDNLSREATPQYLIQQAHDKGKAEGRAEGKAEGILAGKLETARAMLESSMPVELISKFTGLSEEEVHELRS